MISRKLCLPSCFVGFRAGFQTGEIIGSLRALACKRAQWGLPFTAACLDVNAAYDSIIHAGLVQAVERETDRPLALGVAKMLTGSGKVSYEGNVSGSFDILKGVRQGDPLS
eukprot:2690735-Prorocentrum_lima.AAC.1